MKKEKKPLGEMLISLNVVLVVMVIICAAVMLLTT